MIGLILWNTEHPDSILQNNEHFKTVFRSRTFINIIIVGADSSDCPNKPPRAVCAVVWKVPIQGPAVLDQFEFKLVIKN